MDLKSSMYYVPYLEESGEVLVQVVERGVDGHLVFPLELCPHLPKLRLRARCRHDVVHDVDVDVVQDDHVAVGGRGPAVVHDVAKDDPILRGGHLHVGLDTAEVHGAEHHRLRPLHQLQVSEGGQLDGAVLERVRRLVDDEHVQNDVVLVHVDVGLSVDRVGKAR